MCLPHLGVEVEERAALKHEQSLCFVRDSITNAQAGHDGLTYTLKSVSAVHVQANAATVRPERLLNSQNCSTVTPQCCDDWSVIPPHQETT